MTARTLVAIALAWTMTGAGSARAQQPPPAPQPTPTVRPAAKGPAVPATVEFARDVVYGKGGTKDLTLNLARPKPADSGEQPAGPARPCIVVLHGGGWAAGNKDMHNDLVVNLATQGYVAATVGYRFAPADPFPAQVYDAKCAVRYLRAHAAQYGLDPKRVGAVGFSAGAHLSMMLGTTDKADGLEGDGGWPDESSKVQAVVSFFGPTDLTAPELAPNISPILRNFLGGSLAQKPDAYKQASPLTHVRPDSAPILLFQGTTDVLVNWRQAVQMAEALTRHGVDGRVELLMGAGHGWVGPELKRTADATFAFFAEKLAKPKE